MFSADTMLRVNVFWAKSRPSSSRKGTMKSTPGSEDCGTMLSQPLFEGTLFDENWIRKCPFDSKVALSVSLWEGTLSFWTKVALLQPLCKGHFQRERALSQAKGTFVKESIVEPAPVPGSRQEGDRSLITHVKKDSIVNSRFWHSKRRFPLSVASIVA